MQYYLEISEWDGVNRNNMLHEIMLYLQQHVALKYFVGICITSS